jgi:hypothetical protein
LISTISGRTTRAEAYQFLILGARGEERVKVTIWSEALARLTTPQRASLRNGGMVAVTGVLETFRGSFQINLERAALLEILGPSRVTELVGNNWSEEPPKSRILGDIRVGDVVVHDKFGQGVVLAVYRDFAEVRFTGEVKRISFAKYPLTLLRRGTPKPGAAGASTSGAARPSSSRPASPPPAATAAQAAGARQPARATVSSATQRSGYQQATDAWSSLISASASTTAPPTAKPAASRSAPTPQRPRQAPHTTSVAQTRSGPTAPVGSTQTFRERWLALSSSEQMKAAARYSATTGVVFGVGAAIVGVDAPILAGMLGAAMTLVALGLIR